MRNLRKKANRKEEELLWQKRTIELEENCTIELSDATCIKRKGVSSPPKQSIDLSNEMIPELTTVIPCQVEINKKYSIPSSKPKEQSVIHLSDLSMDLNVNPFEDELEKHPSINPHILPENKEIVVNPFGNEEDVINRLTNCQSILPEEEEEMKEEPVKKIVVDLNPFSNELSLNSIQSTSSTTQPINSPIQQQPQVQVHLRDSINSSNEPLNPFDRLSLTNHKLNPFDSSDEGDDEPLNPFDTSSIDQSNQPVQPVQPVPEEQPSSQQSQPSSQSSSQQPPVRNSIVNEAMDVLSIVNSAQMTSPELQQQLKLKQEEKQLQAATQLYNTDNQGIY